MKACNQCGKCCTKYGDGGLSATPAEVQWWQSFRPGIAEYVRDGRIWISPVTGKQMTRCPWLRKLPGQTRYICRIYHDRPDDCKHYPVNVSQMVEDDCEMIEASDRTDWDKAQARLDRLMTDSRPPGR